jgi:hypothetical protein
MTRMLAAACAVALWFGVNGAARADDQKDLSDLVAKAVKAHGGADNIAKAKTIIMKGKGKFYGINEDGISYSGTWSIQEPDRIRVEIEGEFMGQKFKFVHGFEKDKGWTLMDDKVQDDSKEQLAETKETMHAGRVARLIGVNDKDCKLSGIGDSKVNDRPVIGVRVECKGYQDVSLFIDKETNQLVKMERRAKDVEMNKEFTEETLYSDFKKVNGVLVPHKQTIKRDGKVYVENETTEYEVKDKLDDNLFKKP